MNFVYNPLVNNFDEVLDSTNFGDVFGPGTATANNAVVRWDGVTGKLVKNSSVTVDDSGNVVANSIALTTNLAVGDGGSGRSSATAYAVLCGGTASGSAHQSIAGLGASGSVLTSNGASALPTFQTASSGGSLAFLASSSASASTSIVFTSQITSTYKNYVLFCTEVTPATNGSYLRVRVSNDAGSTYETTSYDSDCVEVDTSPTSQTDTASIAISKDNGSAAGEVGSQIVYICNPEPSTSFTSVYGSGSVIDNGGTIRVNSFAGMYEVAETVNAIQITFSSGNIANGRFDLYGIVNS